jgi:uncharacterized phage protein gp47/JayE
MINLFAQVKIDLLELIQSVYASFDPNQATGAVLDQRVSINGIKRNAATYTQVYVNVTCSNAIQLLGLDITTTPFTVSDSSGNQYQLLTTITTTIGVNNLLFQATNIGAVLVSANTLTTITTITYGVTSVNNPSGAAQQGTAEETDAQLRTRRQTSVSLPAIGALAATQAAIYAVPGVTNAVIYENVGNTTDSYGTPAHSIWAIVNGGATANVANAIYSKRNTGCGMRGSTTYSISQINGVPFVVSFDRPIQQQLYIQMNITSLLATHTVDKTYLANAIYTQISYNIYQPADFTAIITLVKSLDPLAVVQSGGVSATSGSGYTSYLYPTTIQNMFVISLANISITVD